MCIVDWTVYSVDWAVHILAYQELPFPLRPLQEVVMVVSSALQYLAVLVFQYFKQTQAKPRADLQTRL